MSFEDYRKLYEQQVERIISARKELQSVHVQHTGLCEVGYAGYMGPCKCGASDIKLAIRKALLHLGG